jgi:hypothetical protein
MLRPQRRRKDREELNHVAGTPATVPTAADDVVDPIEPLSIEPRHDDIARRAYALYDARGREDGHDWDDWLQAERELRQDALKNLLDGILVTGSAYAAS